MNFGWISNLVFLVASSLRRDHERLEALCMCVRLHDQNSLSSRIVSTKIRSAFVLTRNETEILRRYQLNVVASELIHSWDGGKHPTLLLALVRIGPSRPPCPCFTGFM